MEKKEQKQRNTVDNGLAEATGCNLYQQQTAYNPSVSMANSPSGMLSYNWVALTNMYKDNGFVQVAIDMPVADAFKSGGFEIDSNTADPDELNQLMEYMSDKGDIETLKDCLRFGRLYGGSAIIINTNQQSETPFNPATIKDKTIEFLAVDRWQCSALNTSLQLADKFMLVDSLNNTNGIIFDKSRVLVYTGKLQPFYIRQQLGGWGASILESVIPQLNQYIKANSVVLELLDEAKIDVLKIFGLADTLLSKNGTQAIKKRIDIASQNKNYKSMLAMDSQDDYQQKMMSFGSLDKMLDKIFLLICSSLRMPYSKVFGKGANGLGTGAELDLDNYYSMVSADIREPATRILKQIIDIRSYQLFGHKFEDLQVNWKPLKVLSEKETQEVEKNKVDEYMALLNAGVINKKQLAEKLTNEKIILFSEEEIDALDEDIEIDEDLEEIGNVQGDLRRAKNGLLGNLFRKK